MNFMSSVTGCLCLVALAGAVLLNPTRAVGEEPTFARQMHTYKTAGDIKIEADVYRADDMKVRPVVVWLHGGALIVGDRKSVPKQLLDLCRTEGYVLVSFDY